MNTRSLGRMLWMAGWLWILLLPSTQVRAQSDLQVIAAWDFNPAGSLAVSRGEGHLELLGGVVATNFLGSAADPAKPNGALSLKGFPPQGTAPQTAGIEIAVPGRGWDLRRLEFEIRASGTASRRLRMLAAGAEGPFQDLGFHDLRQDSVFEKVELDLSGHSEWSEAEAVRIRLVAEVDDSGQYVGVKPKSDGANSYSAAGTWRFDLITVTGIRGTPVAGLPLRVMDSPEGFGVEWLGEAGEPFTVWAASLPDGPWEAVVTGTGVVRHVDPKDGERRFFRVTSP